MFIIFADLEKKYMHQVNVFELKSFKSVPSSLSFCQKRSCDGNEIEYLVNSLTK